jgi:RNA polymerase sigma-70 factor, ECF subfamily
LELNVGAFFEVDYESQERSQIVQEALQELDSAQREVIVLKVWGEMTAIEIAAALDLSANTVASRYRYGLQALKKKLGAVLS